MISMRKKEIMAVYLPNPKYVPNLFGRNRKLVKLQLTCLRINEIPEVPVCTSGDSILFLCI